MKQIIRLSFLLFSLSIAFPQTSGKVVGVVKGEDGTPLYGANVFIKGTARGASADDQGGYQVIGVTAGTYTVSASFIGYSSVDVENVLVQSSLTTKVDFTLKLSSVEGEVVIVSKGPTRVQKVIREGLAKGADRGIHIEEDIDAIETDPLILAKSLASGLKDENFDLILTGLQSDDVGMGQTGVLVGELLNMSTATLAIETDIDKEKVRVKRELESGWFQWVQLQTPSSISIQSGINQPRYPSLKGIMGAKKKEIKVVQSEATDKKQLLEKIFVPQTSKETEIINTDLNSTVERIVEILKSEVKVY